MTKQNVHKRTGALPLMAGLALALSIGAAQAEGIVGPVINSPLSAAGTVEGAPTGINILLRTAEIPSDEFMDPHHPGYGIPAGGRLEIEMGDGFERNIQAALSNSSVMLVTGAPQQGLPGKPIGYEVTEGGNGNIFVVKPASDKGLTPDDLVSPTPGAAQDPVRQRGIKVLHVGFLESAFTNKTGKGTVQVRFIDGANRVVSAGSGTVEFMKQPVAQILPTNLSDKGRNHNWQRIKSGQTLGRTEGTVPVALMLYAAATGVPADQMANFKNGIVNAGVLST
ncbi:MAG: hypothetical protein HY057_01595, partial [Rhodospirillales bacterium]|nr:hypothetical protein [Rhodospirillales bacterium]